MTIAPVNDAPAARDNGYTEKQDGSLASSLRALRVLGNDSDVDAAQSTLAALLVSGVGHGTLAFTADGTFPYQPGSGFAGEDGFTYRARDAHGALAAEAHVTLERRD